jgi:hypothetical protein
MVTDAAVRDDLLAGATAVPLVESGVERIADAT